MLKFNLKFLSVVLLAAFLFTSFAPNNRSDEYPNRESLLMDVLLQNLFYYHYTAVDINNDFSARVYDTYLERIDNTKRIFIQEDMDQFAKYRLSLDDFAKERTFEFFDEIQAVRAKRLEQVREYYKEILSAPFDFTQDEIFETDTEKLAYVSSEAELKERWRKLLKYRVMIALKTKLDRQNDPKASEDPEFEVKSEEALEQESRETVIKEMERFFSTLDKQDRDDNIDEYFGVFASVIEPHTGYFPPLEKENFDIQMSGKLEGIGAQLIDKDGYVKVTRIVPGSASWKQGELEVNDLIIKVGQGANEPVDVVDMKLDDVLPMIRGQKGTEVRLTVKKTDGTIKLITIIRDEVVLEESYAKSAILSAEGSKSKIGLIDLRSFYADFENPKGRRCSRDVKAEVQKLMAEKVSGIIIDLRYNGGGSLSDAVDMTGLFIEEGPVVQVKAREGAASTLDDQDSGVLYDGPLVILVNSFSASASEILAAALQDYGRAIIVGEAPSTFGKGTVQRFFELDAMVPEEYRDLGELGSVKITTQKFFRVNGGSTQLKGVTPDIILPGVYSYLETGEKEEDFPMPWTEIKPTSYTAGTMKLDKIKANSQKRVENNPTFKMIDEEAKWFEQLQDETEISLNLEKYSADQAATDAKSEEFKAIENDIEGLTIDLLKADAKELKEGDVRLESMKTWHEALKKDVYVMEAIRIIGEM